MGAEKLPRLGYVVASSQSEGKRDVVASSQEKVRFTSCCQKAGLRHADMARLPMLGVLFNFPFERCGQ